MSVRNNIEYDRTPYTYLIGWSHLDMWYYGVRFGVGCHPNDLWTKYFTSSKYVEDYRELHGEPDIISVRQIFPNWKSAVDWEQKVLNRMGVVLSPRWLNKAAGCPRPVRGRKQTAEHIRKRTSNMAFPESKRLSAIENAKKASLANTGRKQSPDTQGKKRETYNKNRSKHKPHPPRLRFIIDGTEYVGLKAVEEALGVSRYVTHSRIKSPDWDWHLGDSHG